MNAIESIAFLKRFQTQRQIGTSLLILFSKLRSKIPKNIYDHDQPCGKNS